MKKLARKGLLLLLSILMILSLGGCSDDEYTSKIYELSEEEDALVNKPSKEYVITALSQLESVIGIEASSEPVDGAQETIYFSSNLVDQSNFSEDDGVEEKGTSAGGSIDIYETSEEAIERDEYLHGFDDAVLLNSGSHAVAGTIVIRISEKLDEDKQEALTDEIVAALTSGEITDELIQQAMAEYNSQNSSSVDTETEVVDNRIEMTFSHEDVVYKQYKDVYSMFEKLGFVDIDYNVSEMNYSVQEQFDGAVIAVQIDKESKFEKGSLFEPELPVIISYVQDLRIQVPKASVDCEGLKYTDVVKLFEDAGFTNVKAYGNEIEYTTKVKDKTVLLISINDNAVFDKNAKFTKDAAVVIYYYVIQPAPSESQNDTNQSNTGSNQNDSNASQNDGGSSSGSQELVWIPQSGKKYHTHAGCSNMKNPRQVTKEEAEEMGYEPCKRCH